MKRACSFTGSLRNTSALLVFALPFTQLASAAHLPHRTHVTQAGSPQTAPVPTQIAAAHKIFLSNAGAGHNFPIDATQVYNSVYAALQSWGRYQLVGSPAEADLIFTLRDMAPSTTYIGNDGGTYSYVTPAYQLTITDPRSNVTLWTITSPVNVAGKKEVLARWEAISVTNLVSRIKVLAGVPLDATETADLTTVPQYHYKRNFIIVGAAVAGAGLAGGLLLHHEFENSLASQKASQDAFCQAHNIPLSECAGG
jgi:hypothetical protein